MNYLKFNLKPKSGGFTIIELLVAMGIFVIVVAVVGGVFIRSLRTQKMITALIVTNDNASLALEQMAREMRTGKIFCGGNCSSDDNKIFFTNAHEEVVNYKLDSSSSFITRSVDAGAPYPITADNVKVESLIFKVEGSGSDENSTGDDKPTKVTVILSVRPPKPIESAVTNLQTTITSRRFDN